MSALWFNITNKPLRSFNDKISLVRPWTCPRISLPATGRRHMYVSEQNQNQNQVDACFQQLSVCSNSRVSRTKRNGPRLGQRRAQLSLVERRENTQGIVRSLFLPQCLARDGYETVADTNGWRDMKSSKEGKDNLMQWPKFIPVVNGGIDLRFLSPVERRQGERRMDAS